MSEENQFVKDFKENFVRYGFYEENGTYVAIIDKKKLAQALGYDTVEWEEPYGN